MKAAVLSLLSVAALVTLSHGQYGDTTPPPQPSPPTPPNCPFSCPANDCLLRTEEFRYDCPNGNILDDCGCVASCQCDGCPPFNIGLACPPGGKKRDANGCPLSECNCNPCPANDCGLRLPEFQYTCPNGNILNECGCVSSCQCAGCPSFDENLSCPHGKKTDTNGCPLSECNPPPCEFNGDCAAVSCVGQFGNAVDENECALRGCPCQRSASCPPVVGCDLDCSNRGGYLYSQGCVTCNCRYPAPPTCEFNGDCAAVSCFNLYGSAVDENGCSLRGCPCQGAANCPAVPNCDLDCSSRGGYAQNQGCVICACRLPLPPPCEFNGDCAAVTCVAGYGSAVDENGCSLKGCPCHGAANCPAVPNCDLDCSSRGGYAQNHGCVICACRLPPPPVCEFNGDCAAVSCFNRYGSAVDEDGCSLRGCPCQGAANCPAVVGCDLDCSARGGYKLNRYSRCVTCECVLPAVPACEFQHHCHTSGCGSNYQVDQHNCPLRFCPCRGSSNCPSLAACDLDCSEQGGYRKDSSQCATCQCAEKSGRCPRYGVWGSQSCANDYDCSGSQKCCQLSSGKVCYGVRRYNFHMPRRP